jgi:tRNA-binding protein
VRNEEKEINQMDNNEEVAAVAENNTGIEIEPLFEEQVDFDTFSKSDFRVVKVKNCEAVPKSKKLLRFTLDDGTEKELFFQEYMHFTSRRNL